MRTLIGIGLAATLAAAVAAPALGQGPEAVSSGDILILRLRVPAAGMSPAERMVVLYERLGAILRDATIKPEDIEVVMKGNDVLIMAGKHLFVTVTPEDAAANMTTPVQLANTWASNLRLAWQTSRPLPPPPGEMQPLASPPKGE